MDDFKNGPLVVKRSERKSGLNQLDETKVRSLELNESGISVYWNSLIPNT